MYIATPTTCMFRAGPDKPPIPVQLFWACSLPSAGMCNVNLSSTYSGFIIIHNYGLQYTSTLTCTHIMYNHTMTYCISSVVQGSCPLSQMVQVAAISLSPDSRSVGTCVYTYVDVCAVNICKCGSKI